MTLPKGSESRTCWDCGHPEARHTTEYHGWDSRTDSYEPVKQDGTGCLEDCDCRRWFSTGVPVAALDTLAGAVGRSRTKEEVVRAFLGEF